MRRNQYWEGMFESSVSTLQEQFILHIRSYQINRLEFDLPPKISKTDVRQSIIGKRQKQIGGNPYWGRCIRVISVGLTRTIHSPYW